LADLMEHLFFRLSSRRCVLIAFWDIAFLRSVFRSGELGAIFSTSTFFFLDGLLFVFLFPPTLVSFSRVTV